LPSGLDSARGEDYNDIRRSQPRNNAVGAISWQAKHRLRRGKTGLPSLAELPKITPAIPCKFAEATIASPSLEATFSSRAARFTPVHTSEIEPVAATDIAVHHLTDMEREPEANGRFTLAGRQLGDPRPEFARTGERAMANLACIAVAGDWKNRQQAVAMNLNLSQVSK